MNTLVILLDGAADDPVPELNGKTPLAHLEKPFMDGLASQGDFGWTEGKSYTHLFLLELLAGKALDLPRGLVEAVGMGVPVEPGMIAYRFSPAIIMDGRAEWEYRVTEDMHLRLMRAMVSNLDALSDLEPRLYFQGHDGRGIITIRSDSVHGMPLPPVPMANDRFDMGPFEDFVRRTARDLDGLTVLPWGGGSINEAGRPRPVPQAKNMIIVSGSPSMLGVGGLLGMRREHVEDMRAGFQESLRRLKHGDVFMHVDATDDVSHRRAPLEKVALLREVDDLLRENFYELEGCKVGLVIDHGTSSVTGQHIKMNVPFAVGEAKAFGPPTRRFCENDAAHVPLKNLMGFMLDGN